MSNRVEDLERQVAELQAAVNGLTEELVEMKERVRQVEETQEASAEPNRNAGEAAADGDTETSDTSSDTTGGERRTHSDDHVEVVERTEPGSDPEQEEIAEAADDDMVVPEQEATTPDAEAPASAETGDEPEEGESDDSDIIVA